MSAYPMYKTMIGANMPMFRITAIEPYGDDELLLSGNDPAKIVPVGCFYREPEVGDWFYETHAGIGFMDNDAREMLVVSGFLSDQPVETP